MYRVLKYLLTILLNFMSHTFFSDLNCCFFSTFLTSFFLEWDAWSPLTLSVSIRPEFEITSAFLGFLTKIFAQSLWSFIPVFWIYQNPYLQKWHQLHLACSFPTKCISISLTFSSCWLVDEKTFLEKIWRQKLNCRNISQLTKDYPVENPSSLTLYRTLLINISSWCTAWLWNVQ